MSRALVLFHGHASGFAARLCADGFRHCFVVLDDGRCWILFDGKAGVPELRAVAGSDYDLVGFYRAQGFTVVETETADRPPAWPLMLGTCVGAAKRLLGLRAPLVLTPKRLYRRLTRASRELPLG
ncbi:MAG TPA: hypothetical protein VFX03_12040 [Thermomicrobiales bacterium]|nr:hypothetical protein [Thermomicrobiales bacterium]